MNERGVAATDRVVRLLRQLGIQRAHVVQGVAEAAAHPETVASLALITPAASASSPLHQLAESRRLVTPPLIIHSDAGPLSAQAAFVLAADPDATAVVLRWICERTLDRHSRRSRRPDRGRSADTPRGGRPPFPASETASGRRGRDSGHQLRSTG